MLKIYQCEACKKTLISKVELRLEGWKELIAGSTDAAQEKHVPVVSVDGNSVKVDVGSVAHPMTEEHLDGVVELEEATFSIPWPRSEFEREIKENNMAIYYVAVEDGKVLGYAGMWHVVVEGHITNVGVLEEARCKGIGSMLMEKLIEIAVEKQMYGITLEVRMGNAPAQALYHKYGFKAEGIRKNYYPDTKEDASIMWKYFSEEN